MDNYQKYIHLSRYARYIDEKGRRETWEETVTRYVQFFAARNEGVDIDWDEIWNAIHDLEVMPSMRTMMTAGKALDRDNVAGYNCSYVAVDNPRVFDEILYVLCCGTGVGFSCERQDVQKLPEIAETFEDSDSIIVVRDSKIGWATAYRELISLLYSGKIPTWDTSKVRPAGARLKTFGGRASGPEPLEDLFRFTTSLFRKAAGRKLTSIEVHDIVCKIADIVVVGGVRRSALISLSNLSDDRMRAAKSGQWWESNPQRALANNSAVYTEKPDMGIFMKEWSSLYESKSGERGIFNRAASKAQAEKNQRRDTAHDFGTNPCSEIILRSKQFCNLSEVVVRSEDTLDSLKRKVRIATILGTLQSTLTDFRYLSKKWKDNTEEERLLGVSLTGIMDHSILNGEMVSNALATNEFCGDETMWLDAILVELKQEAVNTNAEYADLLGIPRSTAITCVKPSGTVSQLVNSASGIHSRHNDYYIRTVRADKKDPLAQWMVEKGFPYEDDVINSHNYVFSFPVAAPENCVKRTDRTAIEQLELWLTYQRHWCEHKPSVTISVKEDEWMEVGAWCYKHFDELSGVSFLPFSDHTYQQAPYQDCTKEQYEAMVAIMPDVDWSEFKEGQDNTESSQQLACVAGVCEL